MIAVRTPTRVLLFDRPAVSIAAALAEEPCEAASAPERQGEAIACIPTGGANDVERT